MFPTENFDVPRTKSKILHFIGAHDKTLIDSASYVIGLLAALVVTLNTSSLFYLANIAH